MSWGLWNTFKKTQGDFFKVYSEKGEKVKASPGLGDFDVMETDEGEKAEPLSFYFASVFIQENNLQTGKDQTNITKM